MGSEDGLAFRTCSHTEQPYALPKLYRPPPNDSRDGNLTTSNGRAFYGLLSLTHYESLPDETIFFSFLQFIHYP